MSDIVVPPPDGAAAPSAYFGIFRTVERIAEGGMGMIFRAEDLRGGPPVAIKTVRTPRKADAAAICREVVALSRLHHPGIVRLRGFGVQLAGPWMALELLEGCTLEDRLCSYWPETAKDRCTRRLRTEERPTAPARARRDRSDPMRPAFAVAGGGHLADGVSIVHQLCLALDHLHARGLVHRDVKPSNVILSGEGRATLIDFGLACPPRTTAGSDICVGTMEYEAPEQICGGPVDHRADIYSVGCLLYELVTGRLPFRGDSSAEIAERQLKRDPVAPSEFANDVPSQLDGLILSMLAKAPAQRPESAGEIALQLARTEQRLREPGGGPNGSPALGCAG